MNYIVESSTELLYGGKIQLDFLLTLSTSIKENGKKKKELQFDLLRSFTSNELAIYPSAYFSLDCFLNHQKMKGAVGLPKDALSSPFFIVRTLCDQLPTDSDCKVQHTKV